MTSRSEIAAALVDVCHRLCAKGFVTATDGNVSARLTNGNILTTRSGINKGMVSENDLVEVTIAGEVVGGRTKPSSELGMHLYIYQHREDALAVVHAHPTYATGFATARVALDKCLFPEVIVGLGSIPLAVYGTPSTPELEETLAPLIATHDAILLTNHGAVTCGTSVLEAYFKMEKVEHAAHITFVATMLGRAKPLSEEQVEKLRQISKQSYGREAAADGCILDDHASDEIPEDQVRAYVEQALRKLNVP